MQESRSCALWTGLFSEAMELNSKAGEERLNQLERYFEAAQSVILARQHPVTGLLPASTAITVHGDYTDAWVRDNVYSIYAVWAWRSRIGAMRPMIVGAANSNTQWSG
jgi:hypothetical protein